ncbi:MAG: hypothetical protein ACOY3L_18540 [Pseudomonadota bacterium]
MAIHPCGAAAYPRLLRDLLCLCAVTMWLGCAATISLASNTNEAALYARYYETTETTCIEVVVDEMELRATRFVDAVGKCTMWFEQSPCRNAAGLQTRRAAFTPEDLRELRVAIEESGFMALDAVYGGAKPDQRFYPMILSVALEGPQRDVIYQSFPEAVPMPRAFAEIRDRLLDLAVRSLPTADAQGGTASGRCEPNNYSETCGYGGCSPAPAGAYDPALDGGF